MSQAQEPTASQSQHEPQGSQPQDEPKVLGGGNMDPTNPFVGMENPEAKKKADDIGQTIPSQGPPPELSTEPINEPTSGSQPQSGSQQEAGEPTENIPSGSQPPPGSQA
ncbi:hypothetical protein GPECTOR_3g248 [Gonium pectorale]|uniref:Uncharacterized protein n=1 Tax=Gonium pectorale TaxID=33097 RepID=A0A150GZB3_GONPE|nr:hypothetical protein GPECTOR_3g248 [Gonium pectorale]|eukprot:KXZ55093.1 hypothetical protein GPECTOR_3g248 [Gonium pectorale]